MNIWPGISRQGVTFIARSRGIRYNGYFKTVLKGYSRGGGAYIGAQNALLPDGGGHIEFFYEREIAVMNIYVELFQDPFQERLQLGNSRLRIVDREEHIINVYAEGSIVRGNVDGNEWAYPNELVSENPFDSGITGLRFHGSSPKLIVALTDGGRGHIELDPYTGGFVKAYSIY